MAQHFEQAMDFIFKWEGEVSDLPGDAGGLSLYGISRRYHPNAEVWVKYDEYLKVHPKLPKGDMLLKLFQKEVYSFYKTEYWEKLKCSELPSGADLMVFDYGVQFGVNRAAKALQKVACVPQDAIVGNVTVGAAKALLPEVLLKKLAEERCAAYIASSSEGRVNFSKGWSNRFISCLYECLDLLD